MRTALAVVSFFLVVLPGIVAAAENQPDRPIRTVDALAVNVSNAERYVAPGKCEHEGVAEISELLKQSKIEEMWAFILRRQPSGSCEWHEIGRNEQSGTDEAYVDVDWNYLDVLIAGNEVIYLYHFHPLAFFDYAVSSRGRVVDDLKFSMPSPADIHFMMEITSRFYLRHPGGGDIRNRVVTPYGIVDYALTEAGRVKYESDKDARTQGLYIKYVAASALGDESIEAIVAEHPNDFAQSMKRLVESLNTRYLRIAFSPLAKI